MRLLRRIPWLGVALLATLPGLAAAQSFGKNKVHYEQLEWAVLDA